MIYIMPKEDPAYVRRGEFSGDFDAAGYARQMRKPCNACGFAWLRAERARARAKTAEWACEDCGVIQ